MASIDYTPSVTPQDLASAIHFPNRNFGPVLSKSSKSCNRSISSPAISLQNTPLSLTRSFWDYMIYMFRLRESSSVLFAVNNQ